MTLYDDYSTKSPRPLQACSQVGGGLYGAPHMEHEVEFVLHGSVECGSVVRARSAKQRGINFCRTTHMMSEENENSEVKYGPCDGV